ncbi:MAG TPA: hypothetical protein VFZ80_00345, partial [Acidimicrobiia bacterium]
MIAVPYFGVGLLVTLATFTVADAPDWGVWLLFTALYVLLELLTVEVNDRMFQSSSIMVLMTAGVIFATQTSSDAVFALALMAGLGATVPDDF